MNILVTDSEYKHSLGIVRSLGKKGRKPFVLSFKKNSLCALSKFSKGEIVINENFGLIELINILKKNKINLIILIGTNSFKKVVPWKNDLEKIGVKIITVDKWIQDIAFSKKETYSLAEKINVPIPKTIYPKTFKEAFSYKEKLTYPCVIKGLYEVGDNIVDYIFHKDELEHKYTSICKKYNIKEEDGLPMFQEYIGGFGCAFFAVYNNGKCGLTFQHKRIREYPVSGGASVCAESYKNDKLELYGRKLLDELCWHGVAMVEFKMNSLSEPVLMEINPKFWGSTDLALEAGVDFANALVDIYDGKTIKYSNEYKFPFRYQWPFHGDIMHGIENKKALPRILGDFFNPAVKSNIWTSDIVPTFRMLISFIKTLLIKLIR